jgi:alkylation response protein AidB-like acyl-CoA dehydrogenase
MARRTDPLSVARDLKTLIRQTRRVTEENRCLAPQVVERLIETGLCRLGVPARLGGYEAEPVVATKVYEELAWADASAAWLPWNNMSLALHCRYWPESVQHQLYDNPRHIFALSIRPTGTAKEVEGGLRVSGRWALVSGCELADWLALMCVITDRKEPKTQASRPPGPTFVLIPKSSYSIVDTWHVGGLRGSGSHDVVVDDVFVPDDHVYSYRDPAHDYWPLLRVPGGIIQSAGCAAICLGVAQAAIDALIALAQPNASVEQTPGLRDRQDVCTSVALSMAQVDAARLLLYDSLNDAWVTCRQGAPITPMQRARSWSSAVHAAKTSKAVVTSMYEAAGSSALYVDCPIERAHRDIHAVCQQIMVLNRWLEQAGRVLLGLEPTDPRF